jgi:succinoglycan biosynthesis protein ExoV
LTFWPGPNFGDRLNLWLAKSLGISRIQKNYDVIGDEVSVIGIGTLLNEFIKLKRKTRLYAFGTGYGYTQTRFPLPKQCVPLFLRGPLSCEMLSVPMEKSITDGAYLFGDQFRQLAADVPKNGRVGYIPHHWSLENKIAVWDHPEIAPNIIDPHWDIPKFVKETAKYDRVVTECLHGAILADILHIPFLPVQTSPRFYSFKWFDWMASLDMKSPIYPLHDIADLEGMTDAYVVSDPGLKESAEKRIKDAHASLTEILKKERAGASA